MPSEIEKLVERLLAATGPDRALDWEIHIRDGLLGVGMYGAHPAYTASLDAALTLVPEGWQQQRIRTMAIDMQWKASIKPPSEYGWVDPPGPYDGYAPIEPLALCIAALRARQAPEVG